MYVFFSPSDWFQLVGLIHDVGKVMALWGEPQVRRDYNFYESLPTVCDKNTLNVVLGNGETVTSIRMLMLDRLNLASFEIENDEDILKIDLQHSLCAWKIHSGPWLVTHSLWAARFKTPLCSETAPSRITRTTQIPATSRYSLVKADT